MRRSRGLGIATLPLLAALLTSCENTRIVDVSPADGNPRIVTSGVAVDTVPYADAVAPSGGRVDRVSILGWVVMPRSAYRVLLDRQKGSVADQIFEVYAATCRSDKPCNALAEARVQEVLGLE